MNEVNFDWEKLEQESQSESFKLVQQLLKPLESVIEEEASELETPASELTNKHNRNKGNLHRKQTSIMSSKRVSSAGHPLEEEE